MTEKTLEATYKALEAERYEFLERGHRSAVLTIPSVQPREGQRRHQLPQNFQSTGARGVSNLTSKLMLTLFPPTLPHMRLEISPADMQALVEARGPEEAEQIESEIMASLATIERQQLSEFDTQGWRPVTSEAMRLLVVTGNALVYIRPTPTDDAPPIVADLRRYVVQRDSEGNLIQVILRQGIGIDAAKNIFGEGLSVAELERAATVPSSSGSDASLPVVELYSGARLNEDGQFEYFQEIAGKPVPDSERVYDEQDLPLIPLQFQPVYGASYGRGYVEEYDGDLLVLEQISRAIAEYNLIASKVIFLVRPGSSTKPQQISKASNGSVKIGDPEDVGAVQVDKVNDMSIAYQYVGDTTLSLSKAFLLNSSVQRNGERVTSEEIRFVAQELEDALGGVYSSLADTVQRPLVMFLFHRLQRSGIIDVPEEVKPVIATGLEAISRNHKALRISQFTSAINQLMPPEIAAQYLKYDSIAADLATSLNLKKEQYVRDQQEIEEIQEQQQQQAAVETLGPEALRQIGNQNG